MKKEKVYNEAVEEEVKTSSEADGTPEGEASDANVADESPKESDTMSVEGEHPEPDAAVELESVLAEWQDKYLRLQAEFDNYRKRTLKEKMDLVQTGGRDVLLEMLPVRDDVQRALAAMEQSDDIEALRSGVRLISQKFTEALRRKGVTEIEVKDKEFDAEYCEAVARFAAGEEMKGKVIDVVQTGYMLGERVLRFAKVVVGE
ncbi:nucleotide exchange factor GrpE [Alistipes sp.]|uniref:nucleotide exchange factor GrpE n=1 Tax=Alistipes sp. TaxID=1872444 RepID=UPI0025BB8556|nr:nucleotide exchange factor GrpE [Alistipes sp.]MCI7139658.1 nucleotide exchange factor GrpE [Alistipes sp.]MDY5396623.1 nucleotide exchange factor GrpE [Alistipes sp.]